MCDGLGRQFSYICPNMTLFQQRMLICDHWYMVNCSNSESDYSANLLIGQKGKKFVDDSDEKSAFHRTPRPDLLSGNPGASEYTVALRRGKAFAGSSQNLIGADTDFDRNSSKLATDEPSYFVPSHWSTEFARSGTTTSKPARRNDLGKRPTYKPFVGTFSFNRARTTTAASVEESEERLPSEEGGEVRVNFRSDFKATTPQYPKVVDFVTPLPPGDELGLLPPKEQESNGAENAEVRANVNFASNFKATTPQYPKVVDFTTPIPPGEELGLLPPAETNSHEDEVHINFESKFRATTPQYPKVVDFVTPLPPGEQIGLLPPEAPHSGNEIHVNFESQFKATTPNYPKVVDFTTPIPPGDELGLLPPFPPNLNRPQGFQLPKSEDAEAPSQFYQPPKREPDYKSGAQQTESSENSEQRWKDLRQVFLIPDYDFPLETVSRPGYDTRFDSFQADVMGRRTKQQQ